MRRMPDRIRPVIGIFRRVDFTDGVLNPLVDLAHDRVVEIAVQVGMDLK